LNSLAPQTSRDFIIAITKLFTLSEMVGELTVKNTFFDVADSCVVCCGRFVRRSNSLPRSWTPFSTQDHTRVSDARAQCCNDDYFVSDEASTAGSECDLLTECDFEYDRSLADYEIPNAGASSGDSDGATSEHTVEKVVTLSLCETIVHEERRTKLKAPSSTKLSSKARLFEPAMPRDMHNVLMATYALLRSRPNFLDVQMSDGKLGGTTTILASYARGSLQKFESIKMLSMLKKTLLDAAAKSQNTYVMGYSTKSFKDTGKAGFTAKLGSVPAAQRDTTCWDTYLKGFCPRKSTCRWCHPSDSDLMNIVVMLKEYEPMYSRS